MKIEVAETGYVEIPNAVLLAQHNEVAIKEDEFKTISVVIISNIFESVLEEIKKKIQTRNLFYGDT